MLSVRGKVGWHIHPVYSDSRDKVQTKYENGLYQDIVRADQTKQKAVVLSDGGIYLNFSSA